MPHLQKHLLPLVAFHVWAGGNWSCLPLPVFSFLLRNLSDQLTTLQPEYLQLEEVFLLF